MGPIAFQQVDVFTATPFRGNPVAVLLDGDGLDPAAMQTIAAWTQLSETVFVQAPTSAGADVRLRIFTPRLELPFAGHPVLGAVHALLDVGRLPARQDTWRVQCAAGLLPLRAEGGGASPLLWVRTPEAAVAGGDLTLTHGLSRALGVVLLSEPPPRPVRCGPTWLVAELDSERAVRALRPDPAALAAVAFEHGAIGATVFGASSAPGIDYVVRAFAPGAGILEDPVTGSANACIAAYLHAAGRVPGRRRYRVSQGRELGRDGVVEVHVEPDGAVWIGGRCLSVIRGAICPP